MLIYKDDDLIALQYDWIFDDGWNRFSGFRIDAAKHIRPDDLAKIFGQFRQNMGKNLPDDFISWLEVIIGGEKGLLACDENPYNYYTYLDKVNTLVSFP